MRLYLKWEDVVLNRKITEIFQCAQLLVLEFWCYMKTALHCSSEVVDENFRALGIFPICQHITGTTERYDRHLLFSSQWLWTSVQLWIGVGWGGGLWSGVDLLTWEALPIWHSTRQDLFNSDCPVFITRFARDSCHYNNSRTQSAGV